MTLINRLTNSIVIAANPEPQTEVPPQSPPQPSTSPGITASSDQFEMAPANNFDFLEQQSQSAIQSQPATTSEMTVDASSIFSSFEMNQQFDNQLPQLNDRLSSLKEKRQDLAKKITKEVDEGKKAQEAAAEIADALKSDKPIPNEILAVLGSAGILGIIGGLPLIPLVGGLIGIFTGLTADYKAKAAQAQSELERRAAEHDQNAEEFSSEIRNVDVEIRSAIEAIEKEKLRLEREARPAHEFTGSNAMIAEQVWQGFRPDQNMIQEENISFPLNVDPMLQKKMSDS